MIGELHTTRDQHVTTPPQWAWAVAIAAAVALGAATSFGQTYLPDALRSLANAAGPLVVVAALATRTTRRPAPSAAVCAGSLLALVIGYEITSNLRFGFGMSSSLLLFWLICAVAVGLPLGLCVGLARRGSLAARALAVSGVAAVLVGEGVHGLTVIAESTSPVYWWLSVGVGVALVAHQVRRQRTPRFATAVILMSSLGAVLLAALLSA